MPTSTSPTSNAREGDDAPLHGGMELASPHGDAPFSFDDPYAENELVTRHERTERAIRHAQEQL